MLWRVRGRLVSWANSSVGIQSCPTPPRHAAVRSVPTRQWYVRVPGHALHEKGFQDTGQQPGTKSAFRPGDKPLVNRGFCSSVGFKYYLDCSCFRIDVQDSLLDSLEGKREGCLRAGSTRRRPVLPSPAQPRRPAVRRPEPTGQLCVWVVD